jgi:hypothetical protein
MEDPEVRIGKLEAGVSSFRKRIEKMNTCHNKGDGQFCSRGGGGGFSRVENILKPHKFTEMKALTDGSKVYGNKRYADSPMQTTLTVSPKGSWSYKTGEQTLLSGKTYESLEDFISTRTRPGRTER